jgi:hypothetical protein
MNEHFKRTGPAVEAHYQFLLWLVPTVDSEDPDPAVAFGCRRGCLLQKVETTVRGTLNTSPVSGTR